MKKKLNEKGSISYFMVFVVLAVILLVLFAVAIPFLQAFNIALYEAGEDILIDANKTVQQLENEEIKAALEGALGQQVTSIETQVDILGTFFKYGWIIIILVIVLVIFLASRQAVEAEIR